MVYVDEKDWKYEYQYCVIPKDGKDAGLNHYIWTSIEQIRNAMEELKERSPSLFGDELISIGENYKARFKPLELGSLVIEAKDLELGKSIFLDLSEGPYDRA